MSSATDSRAQAVLDNMSEKSKQLAEETRRRRFVFRRRTKMPFRARLCAFVLIFAAGLLFYVFDFCQGGSAGIALNNWTDTLADNAIHFVCASAADILGGDWSGRELALYRLFTLGPVSYIVFCFVVALVISGVMALIWSWRATRNALDDGTSNFVPEKKYHKEDKKHAR